MGGASGAPPLINYQFYIKKIIKIYRKTHKKYLKISKNIQTKTDLKFRNRVYLHDKNKKLFIEQHKPRQNKESLLSGDTYNTDHPGGLYYDTHTYTYN